MSGPCMTGGCPGMSPLPYTARATTDPKLGTDCHCKVIANCNVIDLVSHLITARAPTDPKLGPEFKIKTRTGRNVGQHPCWISSKAPRMISNSIINLGSNPIWTFFSHVLNRQGGICKKTLLSSSAGVIHSYHRSNILLT